MNQKLKRKRIILTDGGVGQEKIKRHSATPTPRWSALVMRDAPERAQAIHFKNTRAGAHCINVDLGPETMVEKLTARRDREPDASPEMAMQSVKTGAVAIGGGCEIGSDDIAALQQRSFSANYSIEGAPNG